VNRIALLEALRDHTKETVADLIMPTRQQKGDPEGGQRAADVHLMRLPDSSSATKKAPYIIHQLITGQDIQEPRQHVSSSVSIRSICCVYHPDEEEGALLLLNLMERLRIRLLKDVVIAGQFELDLEAGLETLIYPDDTAPYYAGELLSTWKLPAVEREVRQWL